MQDGMNGFQSMAVRLVRRKDPLHEMAGCSGARLRMLKLGWIVWNWLLTSQVGIENR